VLVVSGLTFAYTVRETKAALKEVVWGTLLSGCHPG